MYLCLYVVRSLCSDIQLRQSFDRFVRYHFEFLLYIVYIWYFGSYSTYENSFYTCFFIPAAALDWNTFFSRWLLLPIRFSLFLTEKKRTEKTNSKRIKMFFVYFFYPYLDYIWVDVCVCVYWWLESEESVVILVQSQYTKLVLFFFSLLLTLFCCCCCCFHQFLSTAFHRVRVFFRSVHSISFCLLSNQRAYIWTEYNERERTKVYTYTFVHILRIGGGGSSNRAHKAYYNLSDDGEWKHTEQTMGCYIDWEWIRTYIYMFFFIVVMYINVMCEKCRNRKWKNVPESTWTLVASACSPLLSLALTHSILVIYTWGYSFCGWQNAKAYIKFSCCCCYILCWAIKTIVCLMHTNLVRRKNIYVRVNKKYRK